jgi:sulfate permease
MLLSIENILIFCLACALAASIGTSNISVAMSPSYSARVMRRKYLIILGSAAIFLGAYFLGSNVLKTISKGIVFEGTFDTKINAFTFYINSILFLILANYLHVPISTTEIVVLSVVGIGIYEKSLNTEKFLQIVLWWIATPFVIFVIAYLFEKLIYLKIVDLLSKIRENTKIVFIIKTFTVGMGVYFSFSAGTNNAANSFGIVSAYKITGIKESLFFAGLFMALGGLIFSKNIIKTVGTKITNLGLLRAAFLQFVEGTFLIIASILGIPVSVNQTITSGMMGIEFARKGKKAIENKFIITIILFWTIVPALSVLTSLSIRKIFESFKSFFV